MAAKSDLRLATPSTENRTVGPRRPKNAKLRTREHLTENEVDRLIEAAKGNRHGRRDALMILLAYRHGLRAAEVVDLRWEQVDFDRDVLHIRRVKNGTPATHPLTGRELRALRQHQRQRSAGKQFVFMSERDAPFDAPGFSRMVERAGADLGIKCHAHMLRHACGYKLANDGVDTRALQAYWATATFRTQPGTRPSHRTASKGSGENAQQAKTQSPSWRHGPEDDEAAALAAAS